MNASKLEFKSDQFSTNQHQVAKWMGYAHAGPQYHAFATVNQKEVRYSIFSMGGNWYLDIDDGSFRHALFYTKCDAIAFAQDDLASRFGPPDPA